MTKRLTNSSQSYRKKRTRKLKELRNKVNKYVEKYEHACFAINEETLQRKILKQELKDLLAVQASVKTLAQNHQHDVHSKIAAVVSRCLSAVFEDPYSFRFDFVQRKNKTDAVPKFCRDGIELDDPKDQIGGGVLDIAVFALRVASILCSQPQLRRVIILDEPFKHLHRSLSELARQLVWEISKELKIQIIMVTHNKRLMIGKIYRV